MNSTKTNKLNRFILFFCAIIITLISCNNDGTVKKDTSDSALPKKASVVSEEIPIWGNTIPDAELIKGTETYNEGMIKNVSNPTIKIYSPIENNTGVAILVFPGGGYNKLAIDLEGTEICEWLASIGVTGILLKYRVPASGHHWDKDCECEKRLFR